MTWKTPRWYLLAALLVGSAACSRTSPFEPPADAVPFTPPEYYRELYADVAQCVGTPPIVSFETITWFRVPENFPCGGTTEATGCTVIASSKIFLLDGLDRTDFFVKHELAHAMYKVANHPDSIFKKCGLAIPSGS